MYTFFYFFKHDIKKASLTFLREIDKKAYKKKDTASLLVILIFSFLIECSLHNFFPICFSIPFMETSSG
jgi:hypothetical protein